MMRKSGPESGSVCLARRSDRHGFLKNRHSYFTNPPICPRIGRIKFAACPEKAAFGTVWREDNSQNGLQPVVIRKNSCFSSKSGVRHYRRPIPLRKTTVFSGNSGSVLIDGPTLTRKWGFWITSRSGYVRRVTVSPENPGILRAPFASPGGQTDTVFQKTGTVILRIPQFVPGLAELSPQSARKKQHLAQYGLKIIPKTGCSMPGAGIPGRTKER